MYHIFGTGLHLVHSSLHTVCSRFALCLHDTLYILNRFAFCSFTVCIKFAVGLLCVYIILGSVLALTSLLSGPCTAAARL